MGLKTIRYREQLFIQIKISCPVCHRKGQMTPQTFWMHGNNCGGNIYMGENGFYLCENDKEYKGGVGCYGYASVAEWKYGCPSHKDPNSDEVVYEYGDIASMGAVISCAGQLVDEAGIDWLSNVINNLKNQSWKPNS